MGTTVCSSSSVYGPDGSSLCMSDHSGIFCTDIQDAGDDRTDLSCDRRGSGCILQFIFPGKNF